MIVEEHGMGFWTRVRFPSSPLDGVQEEPQLEKTKISLYENVFGVTFEIKCKDDDKQADNNYVYTFADVQNWISKNFDMKISKSSISMVKNKLGIDKITYKASNELKAGIIKTNKEKAVIEAFKAFKVI